MAWTKLSGTDASNIGGKFVFPASAHYLHDTPYPGAEGESRTAEALVLLNSGGGTVEVDVGMTDADNYFYGLLYIPPGSPCPALAACARVAGVTTCLGYAAGCGVDNAIQVPNALLQQEHHMRVCLIPNSGYGGTSQDEVRVVLECADGTEYSVSVFLDGPNPVGPFAGLRAYQDAQFDAFKHTYFRDSPPGEHRTCPNCNTPCEIGRDDFSVDRPCLWFVESGTRTVVAGIMELTGEVCFALPHPQKKSSKIWDVWFIYEDPKIIRIDIGSGYALINPTTQTLRVYDASDVLLDTNGNLPAPDGAVHAVRVCYYGGVITATFDFLSEFFNERPCASGSSLDTENPYVYIAAESGGTARIDAVVFSKHRDANEPTDNACEECACRIGCILCPEGVASSLAIITIFGTVLPGLCSGGMACTALSGAAWAMPFSVDSVQCCRWGSNYTPVLLWSGARDALCPEQTVCRDAFNPFGRSLTYNCFIKIEVVAQDATICYDPTANTLLVNVRLFFLGYASSILDIAGAGCVGGTNATGVFITFGVATYEIEIPMPANCEGLAVVVPWLSWASSCGFDSPCDLTLSSILFELS